MTDPKFDSARDFSREQMPEERAAVAQEIKQSRKEHFDKQKSLKDQLGSLVENAEAKRMESAEVRTRLESVEQQLNERSGNIVKQLFYYRTINKLKAEIAAGKVDEERIARELADLEAASTQTETLSRDRSSLQSARTNLDEFYGHADEAWNNYEDDRDAGNVTNVLQQRGTLLVHAFQNPVFSPSDENGVLRKEIGWRNKLDLLMALEPSISASAVDEQHPKTFAPVGVVLGDGQITAASARDMGTRIADRNTRSVAVSRPDRVRDQIDSALSPERAGQGWTEFVVNEPKVAGIFFRVESDGSLADLEIGSDTNVPEVVAAAQERHLPIFALRDGSLYKMEAEEALALAKPTESTSMERVGLAYETHTNREYPRFAHGKENAFSPKDLADLPHGADPAAREAIIERFMSDSPFQLRQFPEALLIESRAEGRARYRFLTGVAEDQNEHPAVIPAYTVGNVDPIEATILSTTPGPTSLDHVVRLKDGSRAIWRENRNRVGDPSRYRAGSEYHGDRLVDTEAPLIVGGFYVPSEKPFSNTHDIIGAVKKELDKFSEAMQGGDDRSNMVLQNASVRIASFLYGMSEEARAAGDSETAELAERVASQGFSVDDYRDVVQGRVSENGTFKLTREELLGTENKY